MIVYAVNNGFTQKDDCYTTAANAKSTLVFNSTRTADSDAMATSTMEFADPKDVIRKDVIRESRATGQGVLSEKKIQLEMLASSSVSDTSSPV